MPSHPPACPPSHRAPRAWPQVESADLARIEGRIAAINSMAQIKCAWWGVLSLICAIGGGAEPGCRGCSRGVLQVAVGCTEGARAGHSGASPWQEAAHRPARPTSLPGPLPLPLLRAGRRAQKASVPLDYVLGVGGFDLEKVEADVSGACGLAASLATPACLLAMLACPPASRPACLPACCRAWALVWPAGCSAAPRLHRRAAAPRTPHSAGDG